MRVLMPVAWPNRLTGWRATPLSVGPARWPGHRGFGGSAVDPSFDCHPPTAPVTGAP